MFKGTNPGEATSTGAASLMVTDHDSYIEIRKALQYGTGDSHVVHIVNQVDGDIRCKIYLATNAQRRFNLIVIRRGNHYIICIIFCEVMPIRG